MPHASGLRVGVFHAEGLETPLRTGRPAFSVGLCLPSLHPVANAGFASRAPCRDARLSSPSTKFAKVDSFSLNFHLVYPEFSWGYPSESTRLKIFQLFAIFARQKRNFMVL